MHYEENGECHVGYIANVHTQAFQGTDAVLLSQLTDILICTSMFKEQKTQPGDVVDFDIICGDFNSDNMSPGMSILDVIACCSGQRLIVRQTEQYTTEVRWVRHNYRLDGPAIVGKNVSSSSHLEWMWGIFILLQNETRTFLGIKLVGA